MISFSIQDLSYAGLEIGKIIDLSSRERNTHRRWAQNFLPAIPESVATLEDAWQAVPKGSDPSGTKTVILVQDAHTNNSGQQSSARLLDLLYSARPDISSRIFLEAGSGDESLSFLRSRVSADTRRQVAKSELLQARLQGTEYLDLTSDHRFTLWGVEDMELYARSVELYRRSVREREKFKAYLERVQAAIDVLKPKLLNPFLLRFDALRQKNLRGEIPATDHFQALEAEARKLGLPFDYPHIRNLNDLKKLEASIDFKKAAEQQERALASLSVEERQELRDSLASPEKLNKDTQRAYFLLLEEKIGGTAAYPELARYLAYLKRSGSLASAELLKEQKSLEDAILGALTTSLDEEELLAADRRVDRLKKLLFLQFTPEDHQAYRSQKDGHDIRRVTGFLNKKILDRKDHYDRALFLEDGYEEIIRQCEEFYELTEARDRKFIDNMEAAAEGPVRILIAGGYHAPNLKYLLKQRNISYISLVPQVLQETNIGRYEEILLGQKMPAAAARLLSAPQTSMTVRVILGGRLASLMRELGMSEDQIREGEVFAASRLGTKAPEARPRDTAPEAARLAVPRTEVDAAAAEVVAAFRRVAAPMLAAKGLELEVLTGLPDGIFLNMYPKDAALRRRFYDADMAAPLRLIEVPSGTAGSGRVSLIVAEGRLALYIEAIHPSYGHRSVAAQDAQAVAGIAGWQDDFVSAVIAVCEAAKIPVVYAKTPQLVQLQFPEIGHGRAGRYYHLPMRQLFRRERVRFHSAFLTQGEAEGIERAYEAEHGRPRHVLAGDVELWRFDTGVWVNPRRTMGSNPLSKKRFERAYEIVRPAIKRTPLIELATVAEFPGMRVFYKDDSQQEGGSFKARGVYYEVYMTIARILAGPDARNILQRTLKIVTQSTGNHGIAMIRSVTRAAETFAARQSDAELAALIRAIEPVVFTLKNLPNAKRRDMFAALEEYRARYGAGKGSIQDQFTDYEEALRARQSYIAAEGGSARYMDHGGQDIMLGHGSAGIEIAEQLKEMGVDENDKVVLIVPVGAGGPIGIPAALKNFRKNTVAVMVQPANRNAFVRTLQTGKMQTNPKNIPPIAVVGIGQSRRPIVFADGVDVDGPENEEAVNLAREYVDAMVSVSEEDTYSESGPRLLNELMVDGRAAKVGGTSATTLAALLQYGKQLPQFKGAKAVVLFGTEGNVDDEVLSHLIGVLHLMSGTGLGARLAETDGAKMATEDARAQKIRFVAESFLQSGMQNGVLSISLADLSAYVTGGADGAPHRVEYRGAFDLLKELIPEFSRQGVRKIYLNGMLYPVSEVSVPIHTAVHAGEHFFRTGRTMVRLIDYDTSRVDIPLVGGTIRLNDSSGNSFSSPTMMRFNPRHSSDPSSVAVLGDDPQRTTSPDLDLEFKKLVDLAHSFGIEFTVDYIPWFSPDSVNEKNYKRFFYRELSSDENERYRAAAEGDQRDEWIRTLLRQSPGWFAVELPEEPGGNGPARPPRVVLVKHLQGANVDQALPNPYHPENRKYYRDVFERFFKLGVSSFRVDLGHLLLKTNTRGYFQEIGKLNGERTGESLEQWIARSGMAYDEHENPDGIKPGESFDSWWARQRDVWDETLRVIYQGNKITPELVFETYEPTDQNGIFAITPAFVYFKGLFETVTAYLKADKDHADISKRPSAQWFRAVIDEMVRMGPFLWGFLSNFDQNSIMNYLRRYGWAEETIQSFLALVVVMQKLGACVMIDRREAQGWIGQLIKTAGGNNPADFDSFHPLTDTPEELQQRRAHVDAPEPGAAPRVLDRTVVERSPLARVLEQFPKEFFETDIISYRFLENSFTSRFFTIALETKDRQWFVVTIDMKPGSSREKSAARDRQTVQVELPREFFPVSADPAPLHAWADRTQAVVGLAANWIKAGDAPDPSAGHLLGLRYDWGSGRWGKDTSHVPVKVVKIKPLVVPAPSAAAEDGSLHGRSLEALREHRTFVLFNFLSREILDPARDADPGESRKVLLAAMLHPDYWIRAYAANAAALRVRVAGFERPKIAFSPGLLDQHVRNPLLSVTHYEGWNPVGKLGRAFGPAEARQAIRNKRYAILWTASHLLSEPSFDAKRKLFRARFKNRMSSFLRSQAAEWTDANELKVRAIAASEDLDLMVGAESELNFLELLRLVRLRGYQVERLQESNEGYQDRKHWVLREALEIVNLVAEPAVASIVNAAAPPPAAAPVVPGPAASLELPADDINAARLATDDEIRDRLMALERLIVPAQQRLELIERQIDETERGSGRVVRTDDPLRTAQNAARAELAAAQKALRDELEKFVKEAGTDSTNPQTLQRRAMFDMFVGFQERVYSKRSSIYRWTKAAASLATDWGVRTRQVRAIERRADPSWTMDHVYRVTMRTVIVGHAAGIRGRELKELALGALIHDIGKAKTSRFLLNATPAELPEGGRDEIRRHVMTGVTIFEEGHRFLEYLRARPDIAQAVARRPGSLMLRLWDCFEQVMGWDIYTGIRDSTRLTVGEVNGTLWTAADVRLLLEHENIEQMSMLLDTGTSLYTTAAKVTAMHHETMDGKGYPAGILNNDLIAHLSQLADIHDAARSPRSYKRDRPRSWEELSDIRGQFARGRDKLYLGAAVDAWNSVAWEGGEGTVSAAKLATAMPLDPIASRLQATLNRQFRNSAYVEAVVKPSEFSAQNRVLQILGASVLKFLLLDHFYENRAEVSEAYYQTYYSGYKAEGANYRLIDEFPGLYKAYQDAVGQGALSRMNLTGCLLGGLVADTNSLRTALHHARQFAGPYLTVFMEEEKAYEYQVVKEALISRSEDRSATGAARASYDREIEALAKMVRAYLPKDMLDEDVLGILRAQLPRQLNNAVYPVSVQLPAFFGDAVLELTLLTDIWRRFGTGISHEDYEEIRKEIASDRSLARLMATFSDGDMPAFVSAKELKYEASLFEAMVWVVFVGNGGSRGNGFAAVRRFLLSELTFYHDDDGRFQSPAASRYMSEVLKKTRPDAAKLAASSQARRTALNFLHTHQARDPQLLTEEHALQVSAQVLSRRTEQEIYELFDYFLAELPQEIESITPAAWLANTAALNDTPKEDTLRRYRAWRKSIDAAADAEEAMAILTLAQAAPLLDRGGSPRSSDVRSTYRELLQKTFSPTGDYVLGPTSMVRVSSDVRKNCAALLTVYRFMSGDTVSDTVTAFASQVDILVRRFGRTQETIESILPAAAVLLWSEYLRSGGFLTLWTGGDAWSDYLDLEKELRWTTRSSDRTALALMSLSLGVVEQIHDAIPSDESPAREVNAYIRKYSDAVFVPDSIASYAYASYSQYNPYMAALLRDFSKAFYGLDRRDSPFVNIAWMLEQRDQSSQFKAKENKALLALASRSIELYGARLAGSDADGKESDFSVIGRWIQHGLRLIFATLALGYSFAALWVFSGLIGIEWARRAITLKRLYPSDLGRSAISFFEWWFKPATPKEGFLPPSKPDLHEEDAFFGIATQAYQDAADPSRPEIRILMLGSGGEEGISRLYGRLRQWLVQNGQKVAQSEREEGWSIRIDVVQRPDSGDWASEGEPARVFTEGPLTDRVFLTTADPSDPASYAFIPAPHLVMYRGFSSIFSTEEEEAIRGGQDRRWSAAWIAADGVFDHRGFFLDFSTPERMRASRYLRAALTPDAGTGADAAKLARQRTVSAADPLENTVIIRWSDSYGTPGGVSTYLEDLNRGLLLEHAVTIYQIYPVTGKEFVKRALWETETVGRGRIIHVPVPLDFFSASGLLGVSSTVSYGSEATPAPASGLKDRLKFGFRYLSNSLPALRHFKDLVKVCLFDPDMLWLTRYLPSVGPDAREIIGIRGKFAANFKEIHAGLAGRRAMFINHSPNNPLSLSLEREVQKYRVPTSFLYHGGWEHVDKPLFGRLRQTARPSGVTLRNLRVAMGPRAVNLADGIDTDYFDPSKTAADKGSFKRSIGIDAGAPMVLLSARVTRNKGHEMMLDAMAEVLRQWDHSKTAPALVFTGDADPRFAAELRQKAQEAGLAGRLFMTGNIEPLRMRQAYADADVLVLPSKGEGLPRVVLEAQAMETAVVVTDAGGTRDGIVRDVSGYVVPVGDARGMARRVLELLNDTARRTEFGRIGRRHVVDHYSIGAMVRRHADFYRDVMGIDGAKLAVMGSASRRTPDTPAARFLRSVGLDEGFEDRISLTLTTDDLKSDPKAVQAALKRTEKAQRAVRNILARAFAEPQGVIPVEVGRDEFGATVVRILLHDSKSLDQFESGWEKEKKAIFLSGGFIRLLRRELYDPAVNAYRHAVTLRFPDEPVMRMERWDGWNAIQSAGKKWKGPAQETDDTRPASGLTFERHMYTFDFSGPAAAIRENVPGFAPKRALVIGFYRSVGDLVSLVGTYPSLEDIYLLDVDPYSMTFYDIEVELETLRRQGVPLPRIHGARANAMSMPAEWTGRMDIVFDKYVFAENFFNPEQLRQSAREIGRVSSGESLHISGGNAHRFKQEYYEKGRVELLAEKGDFIILKKLSAAKLSSADAPRPDLKGFEATVVRNKERGAPLYILHLTKAYGLSLEDREQADRVSAILEKYGYFFGGRTEMGDVYILTGARLAGASPVVDAPRDLLSGLSAAEIADFKLYLAALYREMRDGKDFAVQFSSGIFVFRPSVSADGALDVFLASENDGPVIRLTTEDLRSLSNARKAAAPSLGANLAQGAVTAMKLQDAAVEQAAAADDIELRHPLAVAFPMSAFDLLPPGERETQVRFQFLRLAQLQAKRFGRNAEFYFYGDADPRTLLIVQDQMKLFPGLVTLGRPEEGVIYVDAEADSLPPLGDAQISLPTGKIPLHGVGNWYALGLQALRAGFDASVDGRIDVRRLDPARVTVSVNGYNSLAVAPVDSSGYTRIAAHRADAGEPLVSLMRKHLLRGFVPMPVDLTADMVMAQLLRMAERAA